MSKKLYCIEIERESEDMMVEHNIWDHEPTRQEVLDYVATLDCNYDDDYGKLHWYPVVESYKDVTDWKQRAEECQIHADAISKLLMDIVSSGVRPSITLSESGTGRMAKALVENYNNWKNSNNGTI